MVVHDTREYLELLDERGGLKHIRGADWDLEIGGISELALKERLGKALLFEDIVDYPSGFRVLSNAYDTPLQITTASGYEPTTDLREAISQHRNRALNPDPPAPRTVSTGPIQENVYDGDEVDLWMFPTPQWHEEDGGRYIGTADAVITRNADTGEVNAGTYRIQVHGPNQVTVYISPGKDGLINQRSYFERDEPCPIVASVGPEPDLFMAANERIPSGISELEYVGGRRGEPFEVIEGEVTGLPVPARSEIVLEGHIYPDSEPVTEGPFGEWTGYYAGGGNALRPVEVERVYHRDDPIITGTHLVLPPMRGRSAMRSASRLWNELEEAGIPGIDSVNVLMSGTWFQVVSIEQQYPGHSTQVGMHAISGPAGAYHGRFTVIVDDDVDVFDREEVLWALTSRCDPAEDTYVIENFWSTYLDPTIHPDRKDTGDLTNSRMVIDATRPYHWRDEYPDTTKMDPSLEEEIRREWEQELLSEEESREEAVPTPSEE